MLCHVGAGVGALGQVGIGVFPSGQKVGVLFDGGVQVASSFAAERNAIERIARAWAFHQCLLVGCFCRDEIACGHQRCRFCL